MEQQMQWYKRPLTFVIIGMIFCLFTLMNQCAMNNKMKELQNKNEVLENILVETNKNVNLFETTLKNTIEQQFIQNLLYVDQLNKKQISTQDVATKLELLTKKINDEKKSKK